MSDKNSYKGVFNWHGQNFTLFTRANNLKDAYHSFIAQMEREVSVARRQVYFYFDGSIDNYLITKEN